ncbi:hypothetical protein [Methylomonas koyamae]|uniref:hypothetical protein n=1 Tax=Methylomonas koyamae TaxID=702114 RepID=UPI002872DB05|nr:hypothetical protein [Methylomonas koyamae]WNB74533.1 hypothetical protein RI210_14715 [Methylomonas koyamae]
MNVSKYKSTCFRPSLNHPFRQWVRNNQSRPHTQPFRAIRNSTGIIKFTIVGLHPAIEFTLGVGVLYVTVHWDHHTWSYITFGPIPLEEDDNNYFRDQVAGKFSRIYPTREPLWNEMIFEPFLEWLNTNLKPAQWLALYCCADGRKSAAFVEQPDAEAMYILPVWLNPNAS